MTSDIKRVLFKTTYPPFRKPLCEVFVEEKLVSPEYFKNSTWFPKFREQYRWEWLDQSECEVRYNRSHASKMVLYIFDNPTYVCPKGSFSWLNTETGEIIISYNFGARYIQFYNKNKNQICTIDRYYDAKGGCRIDFEGSDQELLLILASYFVLSNGNAHIT